MKVTGPPGTWAPNGSSLRTNGADETRRAAQGYLLWPLAAIDVLQSDDDATHWSRLHARQALVFGLFASLGYVVVLAIPLLAVIAVPGLSTGATVWVYAAGFVLDVVAAVWLAIVGSRFARRARRGELFAIPFVTPIVDRLLRREHDE